MNWLTAIFIALNCFAFSLSPVPADARHSLPTQIEKVVSSNEGNDDSISYQKIFSAARSFPSNLRSREYEKNLVSIHQKQIKIHFESIWAKLLSFLLPNPFQYSKMIPQHSDKAISLLVVV